MFDSKYYKKKYVFTDKRDISTLVELNESRSEYYAFIPRNGGTNYYVVLRDLNDESFNKLSHCEQDQHKVIFIIFNI